IAAEESRKTAGQDFCKRSRNKPLNVPSVKPFECKPRGHDFGHYSRLFLVHLLTCAGMPEKFYIVTFKRTEISVRPVVAARAEIQGDNLVFLNSEGRL